MKTIELTAHVIARQYTWESEPTYLLDSYDWDDEGNRAIVGQVTVTVEVPEKIDFTAGRVAALKAKKEEIREEFIQRTAEINEQLSKYQALEYSEAA